MACASSSRAGARCSRFSCAADTPSAGDIGLDGLGRGSVHPWIRWNARIASSSYVEPPPLPLPRIHHIYVTINSGVCTRRDHPPASCTRKLCFRYAVACWTQEGNVLDAVRVSDSAQVVLKIHSPLDPLPKQQEIATLRYFSSASLVDDPHNHILPLLDVLEVPGTGSFDWTDVLEDASAGGGGIRIAVMPLLRDWYSPPFCMVVEALAFIKQMLEVCPFLPYRQPIPSPANTTTSAIDPYSNPRHTHALSTPYAHTLSLQGLAFLHAHGVAHRYCIPPSFPTLHLTFVLPVPQL